MRPAVLGAGLSCHASLLTSGSLIIKGSNTDFSSRDTFLDTFLVLHLQLRTDQLKPTPHFCSSRVVIWSLGFLSYPSLGTSCWISGILVVSPLVGPPLFYESLALVFGDSKHLIRKFSKKSFALLLSKV